MKKFISAILVIFLLFSVTTFLFGCDSSETPKSDESTSETPTTTDKTPDTTQEASKDPVGDFHEIVTSGSQLLMKTAEFEMYTWETIYKYSDGKSVDDTFAYLLDKAESADTIEACQNTVADTYAAIAAGDYDSELKTLALKCKNAYDKLHTIVVSASGTYGEFKEEYNDAVVNMAFNYDEFTDCLIRHGYLDE